ncbi:hypothetical protein [Amycolatopsis sp. SID8362]|nr:hypothetical protein [Amycolatopsis sp. SID8362]NBH09018.1 hypothetical protein [Amycolatopsis sp. SID8362]NED45710.1 hypothetical protein [Amycolatopsis sp. SID8362]
MADEPAARWWGETGGPRPDPPGWWPEPDNLHWVGNPEPEEEPPARPP